LPAWCASVLPVRATSASRLANTRYLHEQWQSEKSDDDGDGMFEYQADGISGVIYSQQWLDAQGHVFKRVQYKGTCRSLARSTPTRTTRPTRAASTTALAKSRAPKKKSPGGA
jgi:hypothetical protein